MFDDLDRALLHARCSEGRSALLCELLDEFYATSAWLSRSDEAGCTEELESLLRVVESARAHHARQGSQRVSASQLYLNGAQPA